MKTISKAKPFIKWVGGKGQLIEQLDAQLPEDFENWDDVTYIEPFVGGGAMLFYMLQQYPNIRHAVINDVNPDLTTCYRVVRAYNRARIYERNSKYCNKELPQIQLYRIRYNWII
jgi:DNA adenine methylase